MISLQAQNQYEVETKLESKISELNRKKFHQTRFYIDSLKQTLHITNKTISIKSILRKLWATLHMQQLIN